jgi:hypothetical protein
MNFGNTERSSVLLKGALWNLGAVWHINTLSINQQSPDRLMISIIQNDISS